MALKNPPGSSPGPPAGSPPHRAATDGPPGGQHGSHAITPAVADDIELVGKYQGSGYKQDPFLARRADGQAIQLSELLYLVAEHADGRRNLEEIAEAVSAQYSKTVSPDNVAYLIERKLKPLGVVQLPGEPAVRPAKPDPLLRLRFKKVLLPQRAVETAASLLRPLFWPPVVLAMTGAFAAMDVWYFGVHGVAQGVRQTLYNPSLILIIYGLLIASVAWHELGHATGCRYGGARPGPIGFGIYIVWPAFYTDVTDSYRLGKAGRVRTDLGGIYFNMIFSLACTAMYFQTRFEPLLIVVLLQHVLIAYQFMPFLRLDGYYVISDLTGVPDLFSRVKPILRSLVPGKGPDKEVRALKKWVRIAVTAWVLLMIPVLLYAFLTMLISAPRVIATGYDSLASHWEKLSENLRNGSPAGVAAGSVQIGMLLAPMAGMTVTSGRLGKRLASGAANLTRGRPAARAAVVGLLAAAAGMAVWILLPNGDYRPIHPREKGTIPESFSAVRRVAAAGPVPGAATGNPSPQPEASATSESSPGAARQPGGSPIPSATPSAAPSATPTDDRDLEGGSVR